VASYDHELPHPSKFWNNNGWRLSGITTLQTGFPITVADTGFRSLNCDGFVFYDCWDGPNGRCVIPARHVPGEHRAQAEQPNCALIGMLGLALAKEVRFSESRSLELRLGAVPIQQQLRPEPDGRRPRGATRRENLLLTDETGEPEGSPVEKA